MKIDITAATSRLAEALLAPLQGGGAKADALARAEAQKLTASIVTIGDLLGSGQIDAEEAKVLLRIQRAASESVLVSLAEVSRVAAHGALSAGLRELVQTAGEAIGGTLKGAILAS